MKKNGFTLSELLAVIIILAVIAVIIVPTVYNVVYRSKKKAFEASVTGIANVIKDKCRIDKMANDPITKSYTVDGKSISPELKFDGKITFSGTINVDDNCNVDYILSDNTFCAKNSKYNENVKIGDLVEGECAIKHICKRATTLHTEECEYSDTEKNCNGAGYSETGSKGTSTITYGNLGTKGTLTSGDAFDCDVNGDGVYDGETERFYYVSDYYNTKSKEFESDKAVLIYYNNTTTGIPDNTSTSFIAYYAANNENWHGPVTAITNLPTRDQWANVDLINGMRDITTETSATETIGGILPTEFDYSNYIARLLTVQEVNSACAIGNAIVGEMDNCNYLMENTKYSSASLGAYGYWLENPRGSTTNNVWILSGLYRYVSMNYGSYSNLYATRPVIELYKTDIEI